MSLQFPTAAAAAGDRWEWAGPGARRLASCVLARISFPPKLRQGWCGSLTRRSVDTGAGEEGPRSFTITEKAPTTSYILGPSPG